MTDPHLPPESSITNKGTRLVPQINVNARQVFCSEEEEQVSNVSGNLANEEPPREDDASPPTVPGMAFREGRSRRYDKRLEIAEYFMAIAESVKLWLSVVPWRVRVLYGGERLLSKLGAEEEALPWPPDTESGYNRQGNTDQEAGGCIESEATLTPVFGPEPQPRLLLCAGGNGEGNISGDANFIVEGDELPPSSDDGVEKFPSECIAGAQHDACADDVSEKRPAESSSACIAEDDASYVGQNADEAAVGVPVEAAYRERG